MLQRPQLHEYTPFQSAYVDLVPEDDVLAVMAGQVFTVEQLAAGITAEQEGFRYAPGKWSVRQVFGHLADAERIFGYRALCIARGQQEALPPFDENLFVETAAFDRRTLADLSTEWKWLRQSALSMLRPLEDGAWVKACEVNGVLTTTRAVAWVLAGHLRHHLVIFNDRYGIAPRP